MKEPVQLKSDYIFQACEKAGVTVRKCKKGEEGIYINGKKVDIPSYLCKAGDVLSIKKKSLDSEKIKAVLEANASRPVPQWLEVSNEANTAKVTALPERDQIAVPVEEHFIVEFYSK